MPKIFVPLAGSSPIVTEYDAPAREFMRLCEAQLDVIYVDDPVSADIIVIFEKWGTKFMNYASELEECPFVRSHLEKILVINCDDLGRGFLPGCYTSLYPRNFCPDYHRAIPYPYDINLEVLNCAPESSNTQPEYLFSFRGTTKSAPVREVLFAQFGNHPDGRMVLVDTVFHQHSQEQKRDYATDIRNSSFVLCPRGWSPSTYRLYQVMAMGRCPIIISDDWIPVPNVEWDSCSIRIAERETADLPRIAAARRDEAGSLGRRAREVWEAQFSPQARPRHYLGAIVALHRMKRRCAEELRKQWRSAAFLGANEWLPRQRLMRRLKRLVRVPR